MSKIIAFANEKSLDEYKSLGCGRWGKCYLYNNDTAVKVFNNNLTNQSGDCTKQFLESLFEIDNETYCFPKGLVYIGGALRGYHMSYAKGNQLLNLNENAKLLTIEESIEKVEMDTKNISDRGIQSRDVDGKNIIFHNNFKIVDTDAYKFYPGINPKSCYEMNMAEFNNSLVYALLNNDRNILNFIRQTNDLNLMYEDIMMWGSVSLKDFLYLLRTELSNYTNSDIGTVKELRKSSQKIKI